MAPRLDAGGPVVTLELPMPERETLARVISGTKQVSGMKQEGAPLSTHMLRRIRGGATMVTPLDVPETRYFSCLPED